MPSLSLVAAVNDDRVLNACLGASAEALGGAELLLERGARCAGTAYNRASARATADVLVFIHQDVYLPPGWIEAFSAALAHLEQLDPSWGVLGVYGVTVAGRPRGWTYSTGLGRLLGQPFSVPQTVRTLDEMLLVIRRSSGLRFSESLPGFHMYGTDICLEAERRGLKNCVIPAFALHNSKGIRHLPWAFWRACLHVQRTHYDLLPVTSPCVTIPRSRVALLAQAFASTLRSLLRSKRVGGRVAAPAELHRSLIARGALLADRMNA